MSPKARAVEFSVVRFPRVSGDEPALIAAVNPTFAFSPRERG